MLVDGACALACLLHCTASPRCFHVGPPNPLPRPLSPSSPFLPLRPPPLVALGALQVVHQYPTYTTAWLGAAVNHSAPVVCATPRLLSRRRCVALTAFGRARQSRMRRVRWSPHDEQISNKQWLRAELSFSICLTDGPGVQAVTPKKRRDEHHSQRLAGKLNLSHLLSLPRNTGSIDRRFLNHGSAPPVPSPHSLPTSSSSIWTWHTMRSSACDSWC